MNRIEIDAVLSLLLALTNVPVSALETPSRINSPSVNHPQDNFIREFGICSEPRDSPCYIPPLKEQEVTTVNLTMDWKVGKSTLGLYGIKYTLIEIMKNCDQTCNMLVYCYDDVYDGETTPVNMISLDHIMLLLKQHEIVVYGDGELHCETRDRYNPDNPIKVALQSSNKGTRFILAYVTTVHHTQQPTETTEGMEFETGIAIGIVIGIVICIGIVFTKRIIWDRITPSQHPACLQCTCHESNNLLNVSGIDGIKAETGGMATTDQ